MEIFTNDGIINIESGLYFGNKNKFDKSEYLYFWGK